MTNLTLELASHLALKQRLLEAYPELAEDERTLSDTLDGCSTLNEAIIAVVRSMEEDRVLCAALEIHIEEMRERQKRLEERIEKRRAIVTDAMAEAGLKTITAPEFTLSLRTGSPSVVITDEAQIPPHFFTVPDPPAPRLDKRAIAGTLKAGIEVPGACLSNAAATIAVRRT